MNKMTLELTLPIIFLYHRRSHGDSTGSPKTSIVWDLLLVWRTITNGVTVQTSKTRGNYCKNGCSTAHSATSHPTLMRDLPVNAAPS